MSEIFAMNGRQSVMLEVHQSHQMDFPGFVITIDGKKVAAVVVGMDRDPADITVMVFKNYGDEPESVAWPLNYKSEEE